MISGSPGFLIQSLVQKSGILFWQCFKQIFQNDSAELSRFPAFVTRHKKKKSSANNLCDKIGVPFLPPLQGEPLCGFAPF
ncbi:uncharacterized [Tachysurus ichikawai]